MKIEPLTEARIDEAVRIEQSCFSRPLSRQSLENEIKDESYVLLAAVEDGKAEGYASMNIAADEGYVINVAVCEKFRRRGFGFALVEALVTFAKKHSLCFLTLEVRKSNAAARSLYEKFGFVKVGERKNYYSRPCEDAVLMTKYF